MQINLTSSPVCLAAVVLCILGVCSGCQGFGHTERVEVPPATEAGLTEDGSLVLAIYVERESQSQRSGWHWIVVSPEQTRLLLGQTTLHTAKKRGTLCCPFYLDYEEPKRNAEIFPPLLASGLDQPYPLPEGLNIAERLSFVAVGSDGSPNAKSRTLRLDEPAAGASYPTPYFKISTGTQYYTRPIKRIANFTADASAFTAASPFLLLYVIWYKVHEGLGSF